MTAIDRVAVVIPARDEAELIQRCLAAVAVARQRVLASGAVSRVEVVVVADRCRDATADLARRAGVRVLTSTAGRVGSARARGSESALDSLLADGHAASAVWLATTDADSAVPPEWLQVQLAVARSGVDAVVGSVVPERSGLGAGRWKAWQSTHPVGRETNEIYGASLGVRADAYLRVGGFHPLTTGEDVDLVHRLRAAGARVVESAAAPVLTSSRRDGRAPDGFAHWLSSSPV